jgi:DNA-binding CsgD family transcriptional regulator
VDRLLERERELAAVDELLDRASGILVIEGGVGVGKTSLLDAASRRAAQLGFQVLRARGSELEAEFAFGVVRQLFERRVAAAPADGREALLAGPAAAVRPLLLGEPRETFAADTSFAVLHGLYWLAANLADQRPMLIAVDDGQWVDEPSLRWLAHLTPRLDGLAVAVLVALRPGEAGSARESLLALRVQSASVRPGLLSRDAVVTVVRSVLGSEVTEDFCNAMWDATGGNPLYLSELLRSVELKDRSGDGGADPTGVLLGGVEAIAQRVLTRLQRLDPRALKVAQALAVLGDGCESRHAAAVAGLDIAATLSLVAELVRAEVLAADDPPRFIHPVIRAALEESLPGDGRDAGHRCAARVLYDDGAPSGQVAAHLMLVRPAGDEWVLARLREAAADAIGSGAPHVAAGLLARALAEPPPRATRVDVLRELARAEASAGRETACLHLEKALELAADPRERAEIALEVAESYASLFRWVDAVDVIERALTELGDSDEALAARLEGELVVCGVHDARRASRVAPVLARLSSRTLSGGAVEALGVARGMAMTLAGEGAEEVGAALEEILMQADPAAENWDTRAALLWTLVTVERYDAVQSALGPMHTAVQRSGSARGFVAAYSTLGLLKLRLGALPEADAAARVALRVLQEGDFAPGLAFAVTVLADVAVEAGELDEAQALIARLPQEGWPAGVSTVLIPAARGRLRLAQGDPAEALADFERCAAMFSPELWGTEMRDVGYLHARSGAALALWRLGEHDRARELAQSELADVSSFGAPRALGIASRVAGLIEGGDRGVELLERSVLALRGSPALLERARSLAELGAARRRAGERRVARELLGEALDLAARCGARPLAARAREELRAAGARPRRAWRTGVEALTPSELRIVRLAVEGRTNREIAQELYVTLKTVEGHLSRAYTKLGIDGRARLRELLEPEKTRVPTP